MSTRIDSGGPSTGVLATGTAPRVTPPPARPFRSLVQGGAGVVVDGAQAAVRRIPGGPILAAAVRGGSAGTSNAGWAVTPEGSSGTASGSVDGSGSGSPGIEGVMQKNADDALYYLEIQERIAAENRTFTTVSNVLRARHETVKTAIGNIR